MAQVLTTEAAIIETEVYPYLQSRAAEYQRLLRQIHVEVNCRGQKPGDVAKQMHRTHGWTARQLNAIRIELEGMTKAWREGLCRRIVELQERITRLKKVIIKETDKNARHQRQRKLARWQARLTQWEAQLAKGRPSFCFGGRKLFRAQFNLKANGYRSKQEWLVDWQGARSDSFTFIGKAADANGCNDCRLQIIHASDKELSVILPVRKLNREIAGKVAKAGDFVNIPVTFRYNIPYILAAVANQQALSYRFFKREGTWRVHLITSIVPVPQVSNISKGSLGIDLNPECIATALLKPDGNPTALVSYDLLQGRRTADQAKDELGKLIARIVAQAVGAGVPIVIERLDFDQVQRELHSRGLNRRLSKFKFSLFETMLRSRAAKYGVQVISVNPAYSSIIGYFKFGYGNGLNRHESAAIAIARRITRPKGNHFSERIRFRRQHPEAPDPKTLLPPATDGSRHPWKGWRKLGKLLQKSTRPGKTRGGPSPAAGGIREDDDLDYSTSVITVGQQTTAGPDSGQTGILMKTQPATEATVEVATGLVSSTVTQSHPL